MQELFDHLIKMYQRALSSGCVMGVFEASVTFLEQLREALIQESISKESASLMIDGLYEYIQQYQHKFHLRKYTPKKADLPSKKLMVLIHEILRLLSPPSQKVDELSGIKKTVRTRKQQRRIHEQKWVRS